MAVSDKGDILLNAVPYRIDLTSYRERDIVDFSPRAATPGGSILHSELGLYQPLLQSDWRHGFGHAWYDDAAGYMRTEGNVDTRQAGVAMLFTKASQQSVVTNIAVNGGFLNFNNTVYAWGSNGLWSYSAGTWTQRDSSNIIMALATSNYIFFNAALGRIKKYEASGHTVSNAGANGGAGDYIWGAVAGGRIYFGKRLYSRVHHSDQEDLSDLEGGSGVDEGMGVFADDLDKIPVGTGGFAMTGAVVYAGKLYIFKANGIYNLDTQAHLATPVLLFDAEVSSTNFRGFAVHNGYLVFPIRDRLYQWNGVRLSDITPPQINDQFPYTTYGRFDNLFAVGRFLYLTGRSSESTYNEDLLCFDGLSWTKLTRLVSNGTDVVSAMGYDAANNRLWYQIDAATDAVYYIPFQNLSEYPYADFPTTGTHALVSSRWDLGFRRVAKSSPSILVEGSNLTASRYLIVYYSLDGGAWTTFGTDGKVTANGITELTLPANATVEYKYLQIKVEFVTGTATQTPVLESLTLRFLMRPDVQYGWTFNVPLATSMRYGNLTIADTAPVIYTRLKALRDSKAPVAYTDLLGLTHKVYVSAIQVVALERHLQGDQGPNSNIEMVAQITLVEVG
jgi:hypothetical protein